MRFQRVPSLTIAVKFFLDKNQLTVAMTGSSSIGLLDRSADTLAGRIKIFHLLPACWGEEEGEPTHSFFTDKVEPPQLNKAKREFEQYLKFGGFLEVVSKSLAEEKEEILSNYRNTYFTRDLAQLSNIENIEGLLAILNHLVRSTGSHLEISNFARESGLTHTTAKKYINALLQSELAFKLYGYQYGPAKRYLKASKIYLADNGIITALKQEVNRGQKIEHFVISELEKRRKLGFIKADQFYYYKSTSGKEIDLLFEENDCLNIVEIKSTA
ncbi:MAG: ATP-binding protein, partial [Candidatus Dadabacteria bacterium]